MEMSDEEPEANTTKFLAEMDVSATPLPTKSRRVVVPSTSASESVRQEEATTSSHVPVVLLESPVRVSSVAVLPPQTGRGLGASHGSVDSVISGVQTQTSIPAVGQDFSSPVQLLASLVTFTDWVQGLETSARTDLYVPSDPVAIVEEIDDFQTQISNLSSQKPHISMVLEAAKSWMIENPQSDHVPDMQSKVKKLRSSLVTLDYLYAHQLELLEKAHPKAEQFKANFDNFAGWLKSSECEVAVTPLLDLDLIDQRLEENRALLVATKVHQGFLAELKKMEGEMAKICPDDFTLQLKMKDLNVRFSSLCNLLDNQKKELPKARKEIVRQWKELNSMRQVLEKACGDVERVCSDLVRPDKIKEQILYISKRAETACDVRLEFNELNNTVQETIAKSKEEHAAKKMKAELQSLEKLLSELESTTAERRSRLNRTLNVAEDFWKAHQLVESELHSLVDFFKNHEAPANVFEGIVQQQRALHSIRDGRIRKVKIQVQNEMKMMGNKLAELCEGDNAKTYIGQAMMDLSTQLDQVEKRFNRTYQTLIDAQLKITLFSPVRLSSVAVLPPQTGTGLGASHGSVDSVNSGVQTPTSISAVGQVSLAGSSSTSRRHEARDGMQGASARAQGEESDSDPGFALLFPADDGRNSLVSPMKTPTATVPHLGERRDATELMPDVTTPGPNSTPADGGQGSLAGSTDGTSARVDAPDCVDTDFYLALLFPDVELSIQVEFRNDEFNFPDLDDEEDEEEVATQEGLNEKRTVGYILAHRRRNPDHAMRLEQMNQRVVDGEPPTTQDTLTLQVEKKISQLEKYLKDVDPSLDAYATGRDSALSMCSHKKCGNGDYPNSRKLLDILVVHYPRPT